MKDFAIAVKAFIVHSKQILLIKRRPNDVHTPNVWEIPGGRMDKGEDPFAGARREAKEETGLDVEVLNPLCIHHFTRDDGQKITMIVFLCKTRSPKVTLSEEHTEYKWLSPKEAKEIIVPVFKEEVETYEKFFESKI